MSFNPDPSKQAGEITFSTKRSNNRLPVLIFNNYTHKNLGSILDSNLNFKCHLSEKISKANKGIWNNKATV